MANLENLCPGCMGVKGDGEVCEKCGFDGTANGSEFLQIKTILEDRYFVGKVLSQNGEGVTYIGYDTELDAVVHIREFFPEGLCEREGDSVYTTEEYADSFADYKAEFLSLARVLARMRNLSAILPVYDIFEQNETAYYISEAVEYITLRDFLVRNGGRLNFEQMCRLFKPVFSTLASLHSVGVIHRGISPETMIVSRDGRLRIDGFCIPDLRTARTDLSSELYKGYAAIEQYGFDGESGAWTDVYSVAAVIYRTLIGSPPPDAAERVTNDRMIIPPEIAEALPAYALSALADALQILPNDRTQSIEDFRDELSAAPSVVNRTARENVENESRRAPRRRKRNNNKKYVAVAALITAVVLGVVMLILSQTVLRQNNDDTNVTTTLSAEQTTKPDYSQLIENKSKIQVPDFTKYTASELESDQSTEYIEIKEKFTIVWDRKTDNSEKGTILAQSVKAGEMVDRGSQITLTVSIGNGMITVPNVEDLKKDAALLELCKSGFIYDNIDIMYVQESDEDAGTVIEQSVKAKTKVSEFSTIRLKVVDPNKAEKTTTTKTTTQTTTRTDADEKPTEMTTKSTSDRTQGDTNE